MDIVPIFGIVFGVGLPVSIPIVLAVLHYRQRRRLVELYHAERMAAIERGMELPPLPIELLRGHGGGRRTSLLPGLVWLFVGIGMYVALRPFADDQALLGAIPGGVGLAYLIYYFVEGRKVEAKQREEESALRLRQSQQA